MTKLIQGDCLKIDDKIFNLLKEHSCLNYIKTKEEAYEDLLFLDFYENYLSIEGRKDDAKTVEYYSKNIHAASLYYPVCPAHKLMPLWDELEFYCGKAPNGDFWTMDYTESGQVYHLWEHVYKFPKEKIDNYIKNNLTELRKNRSKLKMLI